jgi:hypothetical protein
MCGFSQSELINRMGETMLVNEYAQKVISERQYKYQTRQSYLKGIKAIGIWDMEVSSLSPQLFYERLDAISNLNTRRSVTIICKSIFKDLGVCKDLKIVDGMPRTYDLPSLLGRYKRKEIQGRGGLSGR